MGRVITLGWLNQSWLFLTKWLVVYTGVTYLIMAYLEPMAYYIGRTYVVRAYFD